ncbi:MAG: isoprenyl transferase [Candidatus Gygaella obscura]|nr:isoprenyl transferase [Candidatus Gygaella obscura]
MTDLKIPKHVAIIMDGNGRWAKKRNLPRFFGHKAGMDNVEGIVRYAKDIGVKALTVFAFSTENWSRPKKEVDVLMRAFEGYINKKITDLKKRKIYFRVIGERQPVPEFLWSVIKKADRQTKDNSNFTLTVAFNYGAREEIIDCTKRIAHDCLKKKLSLCSINKDLFSGYLYTQGLPELDLLIRTSGELRLSNFLLWQASYAELYFTDKFWPDFKVRDFEEAIKEFSKRDRRYGNI